MTREELAKISDDMNRLREEVLSRVRTVRRIRAFFASPASSAAFTIVLLLSASIFVSFTDIIRNIMIYGEWTTRFSYTYSSIMHARMAVQVFAFLTSISGLVLFTKILFKLKTPVYSIGHFISSRRLKLFRP